MIEKFWKVCDEKYIKERQEMIKKKIWLIFFEKYGKYIKNMYFSTREYFPSLQAQLNGIFENFWNENEGAKVLKIEIDKCVLKKKKMRKKNKK